MGKRLFAICLVLVVLVAVLVPGCEPQCTIEVKATLDGSPWSGAVNYTLTPVSGSPITGTTVANSFSVACATWICAYVSGGPSGAYLESITPSATQSVTGGTITFTLNFKLVEEYGYAYEEDPIIEVMFAQDSMVRLRDGALVDHLATNALAGVDDVLKKLEWFEWCRISDVPEEMLDEIQARGEANTGKPVYNLNNIYRLRIPMGLDVWAISQELEALPGIMLARPVPKPMSLPTPPYYVTTNGNVTQPDTQGYLRPANSTLAGIDADYTWTQPGGNGTGVTVYDLEYGWNYNHADITKALGSQINPNPIIDPFSDNNHGTAVIGELVSDNNNWGTTGICYGASLKTCGTYYYHYFPLSKNYKTWYDPAGAIIYAIADALKNPSAAAVILLEQQWDYGPWPDDIYPYRKYIPIEWYETRPGEPQTYNPVYVAIVNAVWNGIHVVEAGGNGNVNTDSLTWFGDSGAIIVGAGGNLERLSFSSYGSRFNLQGWGENVVTTSGINLTGGYGDLYKSEGGNYSYTKTFSGTSSASPIVAGAVAVVAGKRRALGLPPLSPAAMRSFLVATGTPQKPNSTENIGPLPDLSAANFAVDAGNYHMVGLKAGGTVVAMGWNESGQCNVGGWTGTGIIQVAAGGEHTVGLKTGGTVVAVGYNGYGQCNVSGWRDIIQVAAGGEHTVGLRSDGTVVATGLNQFGQLNIGNWTNIVQVSAGQYHTVGLRSDGTVVAVGWNESGQCNVGGWTGTGIIQVAAGGEHTVGLRSDGTVVAVGYNASGQLNVGGWTGTGVIQVAAGLWHTVGLRFNGTVVAVGVNFQGQCNVDNWTDIIQVAAGGEHTVGLESDGTVVAVGANVSGQLNVGGWDLN